MNYVDKFYKKNQIIIMSHILTTRYKTTTVATENYDLDDIN